jgi:hypothetical protein
MQMRRVSVGVASAAAVLAFVACGGEDDVDKFSGGARPGPALNGLETKTGPEVMRAAADALRNVSSVHIAARGEVDMFDLRIVAPDGATGTISTEGIVTDIVQLGTAKYVRYHGSVPSELTGKTQPERWIDVSTSGDADTFTIASIADDISDGASSAKPQVQQTVEAGQPAVLVDSTDGSKLWVSNVGPPLPIREIDEDGVDGTLTEYGAKFDITAPPVGELANPPSSA